MSRRSVLMIEKLFERYLFILSRHPRKNFFRFLSLAVLIFPIVLLMVFNFKNTYAEFSRKLILHKENATELSATIVKERLDSFLNFGKALATRPFLIKYVDEKKWLKATFVLEDVRHVFPFVERIVLFDPEATIRGEFPSLGVIGESRKNLQWYKEFKKTPIPMITGAYMRGAPPRYNVVSAILPIYSREGNKVTAILMLQIKLDHFYEWAQTYRSPERGEFIVILDQYGKVVFDPSLDLQKEIYDYSSLPLAQKMLKGQSGVEFVYNTIFKEDRLVGYRAIPPYGWGVFVVQPTQLAMKERNERIFELIWTSVLGLGFFIILVILFFLIIFKNRTIQEELRAKATAQMANKTKSEFVSNMSHEIRTPLNSILGFTEFLLESTTDLETRDYLCRINRSGQTLLALINNILELSKIEAGVSLMEMKPAHLMTLLSDTVEMQSEKIKKSKLNFILEVQPHLQSIWFLTDRLKLQRVLLNLLSNAVKFTEQGEVKLRVRQEAKFLSFDVIDSGIGISKNKQSLLFQRFSQIDSSLTKKYQGSGLGLSICKEIVEMMGGSIQVHSEKKKGSVFTFKIPLTETVESKKEEVALIKDSAILEEKLRILLADDSDENRTLIQVYLKKLPYQIDTAVNGVEAVKQFKLKKYDIVLMDMQMPEMDGFEATRQIRKWEKSEMKKETPIIALTGFALKEEQEKCLFAGCSEHAAKPIKKAELLRIIASHVEIKKV